MRYLIAILAALVIVVTQLLYGGVMRPVFALPGLLLVAVAGALGAVAIFWKNLPSPSPWGLASVFSLFLWLAWRTMESPDTWMAASYLRLIVGCLVIYVTFACVVTNPLHRLAFVVVLLAASLVQAACAVWQFARPETGPLLPWLSEQLRLWYAPRWNGRGHGTYLNANHLVWFLNVVVLMALSLICWSRWGLKVKILCLYIALAGIAGVLVTLSRGGFIAAGAGVIVFVLLCGYTLAWGAKDRRTIALLITTAVAVLMGSAVLLIFKSSFMVQKRVDELVSDAYRPAVFEAVLRQAQLEPVFGTGAGTFLYFGRAFREMNAFSDDVFAHNDWMQIAADFGFPALALLVAVVVIHGAAGWRGLRKVLLQRMSQSSRPQSHAAAVMIGSLSCLAVFVVHSFFDFNMQIPANALLAAAVLGMLANSGVSSTRAKDRLAGGVRRVGCALGAAAAIWLSSLVFQAAGPEVFWLQAENAFLDNRASDARTAAATGLQFGPHSRLERTAGEIYLGAAYAGDRLQGRIVWGGLAAEHFAKSLDLNPWDALTHLKLAEALDVAGRPGAAIPPVIEAIRRFPLNGAAYEYYGRLLENDGRWAEALQAYRTAATLAGNSQARKKAQALSKKMLILNR